MKTRKRHAKSSEETGGIDRLKKGIATDNPFSKVYYLIH